MSNGLLIALREALKLLDTLSFSPLGQWCNEWTYVLKLVHGGFVDLSPTLQIWAMPVTVFGVGIFDSAIAGCVHPSSR